MIFITRDGGEYFELGDGGEQASTGGIFPHKYGTFFLLEGPLRPPGSAVPGIKDFALTRLEREIDGMLSTAVTLQSTGLPAWIRHIWSRN